MNELRPVCKKCGEIHERCNGHRKSDGKPCRRWPKTGGKVCRLCGGGAPQVEAARQRREAAREAAETVAALGLPRDVAPPIALLELVHSIAGQVAWLEAKVRRIDPAKFMISTMIGRQPNEWAKLLFDRQKALAEVAARATALGIAKDIVDAQKALGQSVGTYLRAVLDDLDLTEEQETQADQAAMRHAGLLASA